MHIQERRNAHRYPLDIKGCVIINGRNVDLEVHDVSLGGASVKFAAPISLKKGTRLRILLNIGFVGRASICWINASNNCTLYGLKFDRFDFYSDLVLGAYLVKHHLSEAAPLIQ